jgi:pimeloyl-ACP methyl ester carboxylesterase
LPVRPYQVAIDQAILDDLKARLARSRLGDEPEGAGWDYGTSLSYLREVVDYWATAFDWRRQEQRLNELHHFQASVEGLDVHFAHHTAPVAGALPVLLLHGWPTGFPEMTRLLRRLDSTFDVIVPSLPGYSFSGAPRPGYGYRRAAEDLHRILTGPLGYQRYGVHSSGAGAFVAGWLALDHPGEVVGVHTHDPALMPPPHFAPLSPPPSGAELDFLERTRSWSSREGAYAEVQRSKPQSLAPALQDSPAGLAAWLLDKYRTWSDCDDDLESRWSKDELLTVITLHWVTGDIGSSMRAYYERVHHDHVEPGRRLQVPTGVAMPRDDPRFPPRRAPEELVRRSHNLQHWVDLPRGGHFASWEEPDLVSSSIRSFFEFLS